eukprot:COSAG01_NODE_3845_length_5645_cov_3.828705_4_plen_251_part_00
MTWPQLLYQQRAGAAAVWPAISSALLRVHSGSRVSPCSSSPPWGRRHQRQLHLWSFNLRTSFRDADDGPDGWSHRRGGVAELIRAHAPAVLGLQEATAPMIQFLCAELGMEWHGRCRMGDGSDEHCALLWDPAVVRLLHGETRWLSSTPHVAGSVGWDAAYPRIVTMGLFELVGEGVGNGTSPTAASQAPRNQRLAVLNTHLDHVGQQARKESAAALRSLLWTASYSTAADSGDGTAPGWMHGVRTDCFC